MLADVVDRTNVGVVQRRGRLRFAVETLHRSLVIGQVVGKELESDLPFEPGVLRLVDDTHSPAADLGEDLVVRDSLADHVNSGYLAVVRSTRITTQGKGNKCLTVGVSVYKFWGAVNLSVPGNGP